MIRGFFFDLDGTLVNTYEADYLAYRDAIEEVMHTTIDQGAYNALHGKEMRAKLRVLLPDITDAQLDQIAANKKQRYHTYLHLTEPNETLIRFMAEFAEHNAMVLVTTAKEDNARKVLYKHDLTKYFSEMVFGEEISHPKPHPESYLLALRKAGLQASEVIAFEDSETGIAAAEAAGIAVVHVKAFDS